MALQCQEVKRNFSAKELFKYLYVEIRRAKEVRCELYEYNVFYKHRQLVKLYRFSYDDKLDDESRESIKLYIDCGMMFGSYRSARLRRGIARVHPAPVPPSPRFLFVFQWEAVYPRFKAKLPA